MRLRTRTQLLVGAAVFGLGLLVGAQFPEVHEDPEASRVAVPLEPGHERRTGVFESLQLSQAATVAVNSVTAPTAEALADPRTRAALEKHLREVPYAVLKQIYLERQDEQWQRLQDRYSQPKDLSEEELERRSAALFEAFRSNADRSHYVSRGEWKLRGGKTVPYVVLVEYYSSRTDESGAATGGRSVETDGAVAENAKELCYVSTVYLRVGEKYAADGHSSCVSWVATRENRPFALHSNYNSKRLVPYFDSVSVALPGFDRDDAASEWYDAATNRWTSLGRLRFDPVTKAEFVAVSRDVQLETDGE